MLIMKIIRGKLSKNKSTVYVVTRNQRRIQEEDYNNKIQAIERAELLIDALKEFDPRDARNVEIHITSYPQNFS